MANELHSAPECRIELIDLLDNNVRHGGSSSLVIAGSAYRFSSVSSLQLQGIHHITAITADAQSNLDFYVRVLGLRFVKKTVNFDSPDAYHLYYGDEAGHAGSIMTFFEFPDAAPGEPGAGMIHRVVWRVPSHDSLGYWAERLAAEGVAFRQEAGAIVLSDPEGLELQLVAERQKNPPLRAAAPDIPIEHALAGFEGVRAYTEDIDLPHKLLVDALGFTPLADGAGHRLTGGVRQALYHLDPAPEERGVPGAGTVHHVAWASNDRDLDAWRERVMGAGLHPTEVIDRQYFNSIYFREPSGVLFEIATFMPGFAVDEPEDELGENLKLPAQHEHLREQLERELTPLRNPRHQIVD
jgi:glyoxalase family protein